MPRGQGWGAPAYAGSHSMKSFPLPDSRIAMSDVYVTDMRDESGRGGIRRAIVGIMTPGEYLEVVQDRLNHYPQAVLAVTNRPLPGGRGDKQTVFSYPYTNASSWQYVEALVLRHALKLASGGMIRSGKIVPFTTLALDYHDEGQFVVLPEDKASQLDKVSIVNLR
jgi:hypothetical protein